MTTSKPHFPTATAAEHRLRIFQPTRRPQLIDQIIVTPWGKVRVKGRLGQQHADVLEALCFEREKRGDMEDGRIKLLVDPARVRRRAQQVSGSTFELVVEDLQTALIEIIEPARLACSGHLIDHIDKARRVDGTLVTRPNPLGGERPLWRVELGKALCKLVQADIWVGYDPALIAALRHGISQAIARHVLTHKIAPRGGWLLDTLIEAVGGQIGEQARRDRRRDVRADSAALAAAGVLIVGDRVQRVEHKPDSVEHKPDSVEHKPGAWSISLGLSDTDSDT